ncbi:ATP-dependent DNA helicase RecG [Pleionea litopenaei]|uniref:ATP-dependent DNA helicase RecG n=1 Tax=Pleionea litopenaei TaxID=3070815 RepID=A0AA51X5U4_9GAMM|nr:ATP-dependent DNA helicase RecG [Pleionea sp. HL-JVS1]WMS86408.1 ATP-dependent DNA helicase RecG [Pleionea sp. HL-JVS1]
MNLSDYHISELNGVGPAVSEKLSRMGIETWQDLLFHLPLRYEDRTRVLPIAGLSQGQSAQVLVKVEHSGIRFGKRRTLICRVSDSSGSMDLRFFYFSKAQQNRLQPGQWLLCFGDVTYVSGVASMVHPEMTWVKDPSRPPLSDQLTPVYPVTDGVKQPLMRKLTDQVLAKLHHDSLPELLPETIKHHFQMDDLAAALRFVHRPPRGTSLTQLIDGEHPARQRLAMEELLAFQLSMLRLRNKVVREDAWPLAAAKQLNQAMLQQLPFSLTGAQVRVIDEIEQDLKQPHPMLRLVQGDVGAGKTLVAAMAALQAIEQGFQVALMAPTEILAEQHWNNFSDWFSALDIQCGFLVSKLKAGERREMLSQIASGEAQLVVGTHALFQETVEFSKLTLVIVDEQHRFGVHQRMALKEKGRYQGRVPHQLIMTATPIPRTLAMTAYADLETSIIDELPPGRKPVQTLVLPDARREQVVARVEQACRRDKAQAYWVCTLIDESEELQAQAAEVTAEQLAVNMPELSIGLVHGRLKPFEKQAIMEGFKQGDIDLLVATTVIEVGVDVPNANLMVIENPERLGLAQLHQLRGRIGRGQRESHCVLLYQAPLSRNGQARLEIMRETNDGFKIAEKDLEIRGPGEVLGTRQTGLLQFKIADVMRDQVLLPKVQQVARELLAQQPDTAQALIARWMSGREEYGQV